MTRLQHGSSTSPSSMMDNKRRLTLGGDSPFIWDNTTVLAPGCEMTLTATSEEFRAVAAYLYGQAAVRWPGPNNIENTDAPVSEFDEWLRNAIHRIAKQLLYKTINCGVAMGYRLRPKPSDPCVMEQFVDDTWITAFDYGHCMSPLYDLVKQEGATREIEKNVPSLELTWNDFSTHYVNKASDIDEELVLGGETNAINRAALCRAINIMVKQMASDALKLKDDESEGYGRSATVLSLGVAVGGLALLLVSGGLAGPALAASATAYAASGSAVMGGAVLGASIAGLSAYGQYVKDTARAVFEDTASIDELACIWYKALRADPDVSMVSYKQELSMADAGQAHTAELYNVFKPLISESISYATFLKVWKREINFGNAIDLTDDCGCDAPLCHDFLEGKSVFLGDNYIPGEGFARDDYRGRPDRLTCAADLGTMTFSRVVLEFNMDWPVYEGVALRNRDFSDIQVNMQPGAIKEFVFDPPITMALGAVDVRRAFLELPSGLRLISWCTYLD